MKSSFKLAAAFVALALVMGIGATVLFVTVAPVQAAARQAVPPASAAMRGASVSSPRRCRRRWRRWARASPSPASARRRSARSPRSPSSSAAC